MGSAGFGESVDAADSLDSAGFGESVDSLGLLESAVSVDSVPSVGFASGSGAGVGVVLEVVFFEVPFDELLLPDEDFRFAAVTGFLAESAFDLVAA
jgi:hypothetical protein